MKKNLPTKKSDFRSPNGVKGSRSEAEDAGVKLRVDRARRKTVGPLLKPAPSAGVTNKQTKQSSPPSSRPTTTVAEPIVETARAASVPDLPEGRTLLEVFLQLFFSLAGPRGHLVKPVFTSLGLFSFSNNLKSICLKPNISR